MEAARAQFIVLNDSTSFTFGECEPTQLSTGLSQTTAGLTALLLLLVIVMVILRSTIQKLQPTIKGTEVGILGFNPANPVGKLLLMPLFFIALGVFVISRALDCSLGCSTFAAHCTSISCIVANLMPEGYTFLFVMLVTQALVFYDRIDEISRVRRSHASYVGTLRPIAENLVRVGVVMMTLTGMIPMYTTNCHLETAPGTGCWESTLGMFHLAIVPGIGLSSIGLLLLLCIRRHHGESSTEKRSFGLMANTRDMPSPVRRVVLILMALAVITTIMAGVFFLTWILAFPENSSTIDTCIKYTTAAACTGAAHNNYVRTLADNRTDGWRCRWYEDAPVWMSPCMLADCNKDDRIFTHRRGIMCEYLGWAYWATALSASLLATELLDVDWAEVTYGNNCEDEPIVIDGQKIHPEAI
eukprot:m.78529 g.78529  ORF g.78529 m.78529 type:complete len:414 (+) comp25123_c1_seq1:190-1431(+)